MMGTENKPEFSMTGIFDNEFLLFSMVTKTLRRAGLNEQADEFCKKFEDCKSYDETLQVAMDYVDIV